MKNVWYLSNNCSITLSSIVDHVGAGRGCGDQDHCRTDSDHHHDKIQWYTGPGRLTFFSDIIFIALTLSNCWDCRVNCPHYMITDNCYKIFHNQIKYWIFKFTKINFLLLRWSVKLKFEKQNIWTFKCLIALIIND